MHSVSWFAPVLAEDWQYGGFGIYLHWPFCDTKCPYCDFNSHVSGKVDHARWKKAFLAEIDRSAQELGGRVVTSVFFGGGTPSLMEPETVASIIERLRYHWPMANDVEITLEANPGSVEAGRFKAYADGGVNRVSMGFQAMNDPDLRRLGRMHTVKEALTAFDIARSCFERVSFDLIYARQGQSLTDWQNELRRALSMSVDHLSLYQLTIEQGTAFGKLYDAGRLKYLPDDDSAADMYEATQEICEEAGYEAYEVSNHAKPGAESRHNMIYWRYGDYLGIGPGAHGRITIAGHRYATETALLPDRWLDISERGSGETLKRRLSAKDQANEYLMMGLRMSQGIDLKRFSNISGNAIDRDALDRLGEIGMIETDGNRIWTTQAGRMVLNSVIAELLVE